MNDNETTLLLRELIKQDLIKRPKWTVGFVVNLMLGVMLILSAIFNGLLHYQNNKTITELLEINKTVVKTMWKMQESGCEMPSDEETEKKEEMVVWR